MGYTIGRLSELAGISARTLRHYDRIGLLKPQRLASGYRVYGQDQVDRLQHILLLRALDIPCAQIARMLDAPDFDQRTALRDHLQALRARKRALEAVIDNAERTLNALEGGYPMQDTEKFEGLKRRMAAENEAQYGEELAARYDADTLAGSRSRFMSLTPQQMEGMNALAARIQRELEQAVRAQKDPAGADGRRIAQLHRQWLGYTWPRYTPEAHAGLAQLYVCDERFTAHYDARVPGCARFLCDAITAYTQA